MSAVTLTAGQEQAAQKASHWIASEQPGIFRLQGSAGTGKTFLAQTIGPMIPEPWRMVGAAPTHKAAKVLATRLDCGVSTIHSFLGLRPRQREGKQVLSQSSHYDPSEHYDVRVVVLDEGSMIDESVFKYIDQDIKQWGRQYLCLMDPYQLPPVNCTEGVLQSLILPESQHHELTETKRFAGPVIEFATAIRDAIVAERDLVIKPYVEGDHGVFCLSEDKWMAKLKELSTSQEAFQDPDFCRVVAWRNDTVLAHCAKVRGFLGKDTSVPFSPGDDVIVNEAWIQQEQVILMTGTEFKITAMEAYKHPKYPELEGWQVWVDVEDFCYPLYTLDLRKCSKALSSRLSSLASEAKLKQRSWEDFYALKEWFVDLRPTYAITAHKSQGSTFTHVFVDVRDMFANPIKWEAERAFYVAVTRASQNVYLKFRT